MSIYSELLQRYFLNRPTLRRRVTRAWVGERDVTIELLGAQLTINTLRENGYLRAARAAATRSLFRDEAAALLNLAMILRDGDTFVDVGANVGLFSTILARRTRFGETAIRYLAFEPHPGTYQRLKANVEAMGVVTFPFALSNREDSVDFVDGAVSHVFSDPAVTRAHHIRDERIRVRVRRLDSIDGLGDSLVLKIDVENHEREVLEGAAGLFAASRVRVVFLDGFADQTIPAWLAERGFRLYEGRTGEHFPDAADARRCFSVLAIRS